jgi:uncharacterized membrane protein YadS
LLFGASDAAAAELDTAGAAETAGAALLDVAACCGALQPVNKIPMTIASANTRNRVFLIFPVIIRTSFNFFYYQSTF